MSTPNTSAALRKCRGCGKVYTEDAAHPCLDGSDPYTAGMTIEEARRIYGTADGKSPGAKAAEEADRVQLVEALAAHPGTPWGEAIEKVAALRTEHAAQAAVIDGLRATGSMLIRERNEARRERDNHARFLYSQGYAPCGIAACNCNSWHGGHVEGLRARLRHVAQMLIEAVGAGGPMDAEAAAEKAVVAIMERDELRAALQSLRDIAHMALTGDATAPDVEHQIACADAALAGGKS